MCNTTLGDFLPLTIFVGKEGVPTVEILRAELIKTRSSAAGLTEAAWRQVGEALAGATQTPELVAPGSRIILERGVVVSGGHGELPWAQRPLCARIVPSREAGPRVVA